VLDENPLALLADCQGLESSHQFTVRDKGFLQGKIS
jgi:hypothetical protein